MNLNLKKKLSDKMLNSPKGVIFFTVMIILLTGSYFAGYYTHDFLKRDVIQRVIYKVNNYWDCKIFFEVIGAISLAGLVLELLRLKRYWKSELFEVYHVPKVVSPKSDFDTANICGILRGRTKIFEYKLNNGPWIEVKQLKPYIPPPYFDIELPSKNLLQKNKIDLKATPKIGKIRIESYQFEYNTLISLPFTVDWRNEELEVAHGCWEIVKVEDEWRVRTIPGFEEYDRILIISGAFEEARRIETYVVFRNHACPVNQHSYGFGILPLWGGRPDDEMQYPKRGWNFSLVWYYSVRKAVGQEFSYKYGNEKQDWVGIYRPFKLQSGIKYNIISETWPVKSSNGHFKFYKQRMKWWQAGFPEPPHWMELEDVQSVPLSFGKYGIAFVCYYCQVELGNVNVKPVVESKEYKA